VKMRMPRELRNAELTVSVTAARQQFERIRAELRQLPPGQWDVKPRHGELAVARYLAECTAPDDYVLLGTYADDVVYYGRRRFAGGQAYFVGHLRGEENQRLALDRLNRQSVPVAITNADSAEFASDFPLIARHVADRYREAGVVSADNGEPLLRVFVEKARRPLRTDPVLGFPCFR
jgi:hypothetical protein